MPYIPQFIFAIVAFLSIGFFLKKLMEIRRNINIGKDEKIEGSRAERLKNMTLLAFGQKKMFQNFIPAILHLFIYVAFLMTQIELIEIFIDGLTGSHRALYNVSGESSILKGLYTSIISFIEVLSVLALVGTLAFLIRRNLLKVPRLVMPEMNGWPKLDGNIILYLELLLLFGIFTMNGADTALHPGKYGFLVSSNIIGPMLSGLSEGTLIFLERLGWWIHILGVLGFLVYLPYSKHLHILLAFFNAYYKPLNEAGEMSNMPAIQNEIAAMFNPAAAPPELPADGVIPRFGAKDVPDLSWKSILDAYSCTECGRCTAECPANQTGKLLSPRKIMMDTRDRAEELGQRLNKGEDLEDGKSLLDYISEEELRACTTCNACVQACPVSINPLSIITELRRYLILEESKSTEEWNLMFGNLENNQAPWQFSPMDRDKWTSEID